MCGYYFTFYKLCCWCLLLIFEITGSWLQYSYGIGRLSSRHVALAQLLGVVSWNTDQICQQTSIKKPACRKIYRGSPIKSEVFECWVLLKMVREVGISPQTLRITNILQLFSTLWHYVCEPILERLHARIGMSMQGPGSRYAVLGFWRARWSANSEQPRKIKMWGDPGDAQHIPRRQWSCSVLVFGHQLVLSELLLMILPPWSIQLQNSLIYLIYNSHSFQ